jgi:hypothetical protein
MDPALESLLKEWKSDQGVQRKAQTWSKAGGIYPMYLKHCIPLRLSDEQMVERDASILHQRVENRKKIDAKWQVLLDLKDAQIQVIKEDRSVGLYKDLHESSFAAARGYEGRDKRWHAFIQDRMDYLEKFEVYAEQQVAELRTRRRRPLEACRQSGLHGGGERCDGIFEQEEEAQDEMGRRPEVHEVPCNGIRNK